MDNSSTDVGRYNFIRIGSDGNPIIMYVDETNGWMKIVHCNTIDCKFESLTITVLDEIGIGAYGEFPEMQINPYNGLPVLSYFNQTNSTSSSLKVTQCANVQCTGALVQVVAVGKCGYGRDSSLAFSNVSPYYLYVSFMNYSPIARLRKASLAVFLQNTGSTSTTESQNAYLSKNITIPIHTTYLYPRDIDDICTISIG